MEEEEEEVEEKDDEEQLELVVAVIDVDVHVDEDVDIGIEIEINTDSTVEASPNNNRSSLQNNISTTDRSQRILEANIQTRATIRLTLNFAS